MTGCKADVTRVARQVLNRSIAQRTISKQECMVLLADLPFVIATESFEQVNLSGSYKITSSTHKDLLSQYRKVAHTNHNLSLHSFVCDALQKRNKCNKPVIPHYVGANGQPKFPATKEYAMAVLIVYKPWKGKAPPMLTDQQWIDQFYDFIVSDDCPNSVKLEYARVKERHDSKRPEEAVASEECYDNDVQANIDTETRDILSIITNHSRASDPYFTVQDYNFNRGLNYDWSIRHLVRFRC